MPKQEKAFRWIVGVLQNRKISFKVTGGFAAQLYGSDRPLFDIDFDVSKTDIEFLAEELSEYITFGPARFKDDDWDVFMLTLNYQGQPIDLSALESKIWDRQRRRWVEFNYDMDSAVEMEVYGLRVPVVSREELLAYKRVVARETDLEDISHITQRL